MTPFYGHNGLPWNSNNSRRIERLTISIYKEECSSVCYGFRLYNSYRHQTLYTTFLGSVKGREQRPQSNWNFEKLGRIENESNRIESHFACSGYYRLVLYYKNVMNTFFDWLIHYIIERHKKRKNKYFLSYSLFAPISFVFLVFGRFTF